MSCDPKVNASDLVQQVPHLAMSAKVEGKLDCQPRGQLAAGGVHAQHADLRRMEVRGTWVQIDGWTGRLGLWLLVSASRDYLAVRAGKFASVQVYHKAK